MMMMMMNYIGDVTKKEKNLHFCSFSYQVITINEGAKNDDDDDELYW